jgi:hypothetical protein
MDDERTLADVARAMTTVLRYQQRTGRFGREVRSDYDVHADRARMAMETDGAGEPTPAASYVVDADAVAAAIVERLLAGRTLKPPPPPASR